LHTPEIGCLLLFYCLLQPLAETLSKAAASCGRRNLRIVLEAVSTTCSVLGRRVLTQQPAAVQQLVVPLLNRWQAIGFVERDVVPIMEALNNMSMSMGLAFEPYAQAVFEKGVMLLQLQQEARSAQVGAAFEHHHCRHVELRGSGLGTSFLVAGRCLHA
jgi:hypothetical protein